MNRIFLFCLLILSLGTIKGAIITVDNGPTGGGQFDDLQVAADAAANGDTLHVIGTGTSYGNLTLRKQLYIFGTGYNPPHALAQKANLQTITFNQDIGISTSAGSFISGLEISSITVNSSTDATGVTISRCRVSSFSLSINCADWVIENNILTTLSLFNNPNLLVRNNIIQSQVSSSNEPTVLITNNIFTATSASGNTFNNVSFATISNNIFYRGRSPQGASNCVFSNNISFGTTDNSFIYGSNTGSNNHPGVDPMFQGATTGGYTPEKDWHLATGSVGLNAGTDGTDIGIYGGLNPFPVGGGSPFMTSAPPAIPQIEAFTLFNPNVAQGDSLQVFIRARKQD